MVDGLVRLVACNFLTILPHACIASAVKVAEAQGKLNFCFRLSNISINMILKKIVRKKLYVLCVNE